ncbi:MAG: TatD family hydrolase [Oscillospiraceae bacterium]|nr:TatD family hydrolase [Oscillospiraceae bacterium]
MIFDTHAHYDDERFDPDRFEVLAALPGAGIGHIVMPSTGPDNLETVLSYADQIDFLSAGAGFHPHSAKKVASGDLDKLSEFLGNAQENKIVAIGECGLDYHYGQEDKAEQKELFDVQLSLAGQMGLPLLVHDREAHSDCLDMLRAHKGLKGVFHCYSGSAEMVREIVDMGFYISFTGPVTFKTAHKLRLAAAAVPDEFLMIETDAPYLAPEPMRGKRCDSRMLVHILRVLAEVRGTDYDMLEKLTWNNAMKFFGIKNNGE